MQNREIVQELTIGAPRETVFRALTDARELEKWWTTRAKSHAEEGGSFRYDWTFPDAPERDHVQQGTYSRLESGKRLEYPWMAERVPTEVKFDLSDAGEGTTLRLVHGGWRENMDEAIERHAQGWGFFLGNLKSFLEEGVDRRVEAMGMSVAE
jgi:uncharacterized protein YndB with AHSA1/START domain